MVITGASSGIGAQMALKAAASGAGNIALVARRKDKLEELVKEIESVSSARAFAFSADVSKREEVEKIFGEIFAKLSTVDILVNNAGFGVFDEIHEAGWEEIQGMVDVNVLGLISCTMMVLPHMKERKSGHIINVASQAGKIATPNSSVYSATKHAVLGFTNSLRMEVMNDGIFVTAVNPGPIATNFFDIADRSGSYVKNVQRWMLKPEEVAEKVVLSMGTNKREINLPGWMNTGSILYTLFPRLVERLGRNAFMKK